MKNILLLIIFILIHVTSSNTFAQWKTLPRAPKLEIFRDIEIVDDTKIYAVGMNSYFWNKHVDHKNYFIKTKNNGIIWVKTELPTEIVDVRRISFFDSLNGFAIGQYRLNNTQAVILKTTNGGDNWMLNYITPLADSIELSDIKIINTNVIVAVGFYYYDAPSYLVRSLDNGKNWEVSVLNTGGLKTITKVNDAEFFISGGWFRNSKFGSIMSSEDFGNSFQNVITPVVPDNGGSGYIQSFLIKEKNKIIIGGIESIMDFNAPHLFITENNGSTWQKIDTYKDILTLGGFFCGASDNKMNKLYFGGYDSFGDGNTLTNSIYSCDTNFQNWTKENIGLDEGYIYEICISDSLIIAYSSNRIIKLDKLPVDVESENTLNNSFGLSQNYPNPFNPSTKITYHIPKSSNVKLEIFDNLGKVVRTLVNKHQAAGRYEVSFNVENISSGIYFYRIEAEGYSMVRKMVLLH